MNIRMYASVSPASQVPEDDTGTQTEAVRIVGCIAAETL